MKMLLGLVLMSSCFSMSAFAHDLKLRYSSSTRASDLAILDKAMEQVSELLPEKLKKNLPENINVQIEAITNHNSIPEEVCSGKKLETPFIYGRYNQYNNTLTIHKAVVAELAKGTSNSNRITCQHKSLYDQSIATIIHELTHAYDFKNGRVSNSIEYINRAGFKKGLLKIKNKNIQAMRSADAYELVNIAESFAVNVEYFTMDPEFMCRKPSMFEFMKKHFEVDPFPTRTCAVNNTVMMSTPTGFVPVQLDNSRVYRIDYLLASAGSDVMSGFGHTMFRIVMCAPQRVDAISGRVIPATPFGKKCLDDKLYHLVISYRANVEDGKLDYMKGLVGGYPSMLFLLSFPDALNEYNRDELRDLISYPLILSPKEKEEFVTRVKEEHWNYRGNYKFINNNCAVESYDLLKSAIDRGDLNLKKSITPNGVLEDLDRLQYLSMASKETETFTANTDAIVLAYNKAYGYKISNSAKANKSAVLKFIEKSTIEERLKKFESVMNKKTSESIELNTELIELKEKMLVAASFSVMEQQIIGSKALGYRKKAAEIIMDEKNLEAQALVKEATSTFALKFNMLSNMGYGIPLNEEVISKTALDHTAEASKETLAKSEAYLLKIMPMEIASLEKMKSNIDTFNKASLAIRKEYREKLTSYIDQVLTNLTHDEYSRSVMEEAAKGDAESLKKVRELLGDKLVDEKAILDVKLRALIKEKI